MRNMKIYEDVSRKLVPRYWLCGKSIIHFTSYVIFQESSNLAYWNLHIIKRNQTKFLLA